MRTTQEGRDRLRRLVDAAKPRYTKAKKKDHPIIKLLDDADELARLRLGLEEHIQWLRNEAVLHPSPDVFYLQADKLEGLLNSGDDDG